MLILTAATAKEMKGAIGPLGGPKVSQGELVPWNYKGRDILVGVSGVGLINSAFYLGEWAGMEGLEGVINIGIAGAFNLELFPLGSTSYIWREAWPEYGMLYGDGSISPQELGFAQGHIDGKPIWDRVKLNPTNAAKTMNLHLDSTWYRASSVSVSGVTMSPERAGWLTMSYGVDLENMEGYAFAYGCALRKIPFLELRTVSNLVAAQGPDEYDWELGLSALKECVEKLFD